MSSSKKNKKGPIKYFALSSATEGDLLFNYEFVKGPKGAYKNAAIDVAQQIPGFKLYSSERHKQKCPYGTWFITVDAKDVAYLLLAEDAFQERIVFQCLLDIMSKIDKLDGYAEIGNKEFAGEAKPYVKESLKKFSNPEKFDQLHRAQEQADELHLIMQKNVNKALENNQDINTLDQKAVDFREQAHSFQKGSKELESMMRWRNIKLCIILLCILIAAIILVVVYIVGWGASDIKALSNKINGSSTNTTDTNLTNTTTGTNVTNSTNQTLRLLYQEDLF